MLIVFEGLDAVGKTTQITRVEKYLNYIVILIYQ